MPFPRELLSADEEVVLDLRPHWWQITPSAVVLGLAIILGIAVLSWDPHESVKWIVGLGILAALIWFGSSYATWVSTSFVVTNERIISRGGVIAKRGIEIPLDRVNTVHFSQRLFERAIGAGDITVESASESGQQHFHNVRKPNHVQQEIYRMIDQFDDRRITRIGDAVGSAQAPAEDSIPDQIEKLDQLRRQGVLTDAEFDAKKAELLGRM
ncbi:MAG: PH domain-containing protein [Acidimicrobiales bacterium]